VRYLVLLVTTVALVLVMRTYVVASFYIPSASMETTLHGCDGCEPDRVMVDKVSYHLGSPGRTDVVVFDRPPSVQVADKELIKRIIGLPGDTVSAHNRTVFVNGKPLAEPYVDADCHGTDDFGPVTVPAGRYFMMGDNRCDSEDSRVFGTVPRSAFVGRAFAVVWPLKRLAWL
jgi:signal peptidase I